MAWYAAAGIKALGTAIKAKSTIAAIVAARVFQAGTVTEPTFPYVTFSDPFGGSAKHVLGSNTAYAADPHVQIDGWATAKAGAAQLLDAIMDLEGNELTVTGWGTGRLEGEGNNIVDEDEQGEKVYHAIARFRIFLVNTQGVG